jgi:hypothetical protein
MVLFFLLINYFLLNENCSCMFSGGKKGIQIQFLSLFPNNTLRLFLLAKGIVASWAEGSV